MDELKLLSSMLNCLCLTSASLHVTWIILTHHWIGRRYSKEIVNWWNCDNGLNLSLLFFVLLLLFTCAFCFRGDRNLQPDVVGRNWYVGSSTWSGKHQWGCILYLFVCICMFVRMLSGWTGYGLDWRALLSSGE